MFKQSTLKGVLVYDEDYSSEKTLIGAAIGGGVPDGSWEWQQLLDQVLLSFSTDGNSAIEGTYLVVEEGDSDGLFVIKASENMHEEGILLPGHPAEGLPPHMPEETVGFLKVVADASYPHKYDAVLIVFDEKFIESSANPHLTDQEEVEVNAIVIGSSVENGALVPAPEVDSGALSAIAERMVVLANTPSGE